MADTSLFRRLQRLFASDVVIRNVGGNQLKVVDTDHIQTSGEFATNSLMDRFSGIYQNPASTSLYGAQFNMNYQYLRTFIYSDYDLMDTDAIIASALDIIADECTLKNDMGENTPD
jgi:lysophospholipase L1-like esterase